MLKEIAKKFVLEPACPSKFDDQNKACKQCEYAEICKAECERSEAEG